MGDISPVLIALCGLSVVCLGLIVVGLFMMTRFTGFAILPSVLEVVRGLMSNEEDVDSYERERRHRPVRTAAQQRIGQRPEALDFDAAVERYKQQDPVGPPPDPAIPSADDRGLSDFNKHPYGVRDTSSSPGRRLRDKRYRRNAQDVDDEIFGGLLEDNDYGDDFS
jgi:hypothetical protein